MTGLYVPELDEDTDTLSAALAYAKAGWFVGPCDQSTKHPGSILGKGWQLQTSDDPGQIVAWFAGSSHGLFLHVGRSGGLVLDVDNYSALPPELLDIIGEAQPPFQSTRVDDPKRGHYVFAQPSDRLIGNSLGKLPKGWGEVRGKNGVVVVQPTRHEKEGARYLWKRTGPVPMSPELVALLPDAADSADPATSAVVQAFLAEHTEDSMGHLLGVVLDKMERDIREGGSRHDALKLAAIWACREARAGFYPARQAMEGLWTVFHRAMKGTPDRFPRSEFAALFAWAVAQALATDPIERATEVKSRLEEKDARKKAPLPAVEDPEAEETPHLRDPAVYFMDKAAGIDVSLVADDVIAHGPLRVGVDGLFWAYRGGVWRMARDEVRGRCVDVLQGRYRGSHATNVEHVVARRVGHITADPVVDYINFRGAADGSGAGMLDWRTGEMHPHHQDYLSTVQLPLGWDASATCPRFDAFLASILSPDYVELVWEMLGYLMLNGNPLQQAFLFYGTGQNGKGTLLRVISDLLGRENTSSISLDSLNTNRFAAAGLYGKTANLAGDIDATYQESTAAFKSLTGEDDYETEYKHRDRFRFRSWAVPVFSANEVPGSADTSMGYLRRWTVVSFGRTVTEAEKVDGLSDLLAEELPGIAAKAVPALRTLMARGHFDKSHGEVAQGAEEFARKIDQVRQWIEQTCLDGPEVAANRELASDMHASYKAWAEKTGAGKLGAEKFYGRLAAIGHPMKKVRGVRYIEGLRVVDLRMKDGHQESSPFFPDLDESSSTSS